MSTSLNINASPETLTDRGRTVLTKQVEELGEWFHNIDLLGVPTAPRHFLGDFPNIKWKHIARAIPTDLSGATVLDVGCNGGFYFIEKKYAGDQTNWWIPNKSAAEAMLRSSGLEIVSNPESETWICEPRAVKKNGRYVHDLELEGTL